MFHLVVLLSFDAKAYLCIYHCLILITKFITSGFFSLIVRSSHHKGEIVAIAAFHFSFEHWENVCCVFHMIFRH